MVLATSYRNIREKMRVIVTGGAGFIGSAFINYLLDNFECEVLCIDKLTYAGNRKNIKHNVSFLQKDICDVKSDELGDFDYIVHFAAESHVDNSIKDGLPFIRSNVEGTFNLLEISRKNKNLKKFIHISTDEVYGDMVEHIAINHTAIEEDQLKPSSYYSATKAASDLLVISANRTYGLPYLITRTCNNFGEHQFEEKFLPTIARSISEGKPIPVYGDGKQVREWMYVYDNVKVICDLMFDEKVINQIFNIGTRVRLTNIEIVKEIGKVLGKDVNIKHVEDRLGHDKKYGLNCAKLKNYYHVEKNQIFPENVKTIYQYLREKYGKKTT
jgi:dTDP-glucose 4,6-dehydratase